MPCLPCPALSEDENDASSDFPEIFSNKALDIGSSTTLSDSYLSSESDFEDGLESEDDLALDDEEKQLPLEHYL
ncbi:uncharacterized protein N7498_004491 [Penicillium cinerascens]|uniref:Uncharacterized protein n=1 Tax=Penicillium cinerascens TaxID=70096 RepID=A0A9W9SZC8_9EURO|nr:uncharacterized protein N7498_004491 [Penicillium cinerascens]KAJ5203612.1 hypothetical protein N7498_004491 [Penicillium cinerascens]